MKNTKNSKKQAARTLDAVLRVSQRAGREGENFLSPEQQREKIEQYAGTHGIVIAIWHDETDSVSGSGENMKHREGLQLALKRSLDGDVDGIIVAKANRFARDVIGGLSALAQLDNAGRHFIAVEDGIDGETGSTPTGRLMRGMLFMLAQWQLELLQENWHDVRQRHIKRGVFTKTPYGYDKGSDGRLIENAVEAKIVQLMFTMRADGASWAQIADAVNALGAQPKLHEGTKYAHRESFAAAHVSKIIGKRVYLGHVYSGEFVNEHAHPALVSVELWQRVNDRRAQGKRGATNVFALTGLLHCASCGGRMFGSVQKPGTPNERRYYRCQKSSKRTGVDYCSQPVSIPAGDVEQYVITRFRGKFIDRPVDVKVFDDAVDELADAEAALAEARADLRAFTTSKAARTMQRVDADTYEATVDGYADAIDAAEAAVVEARTTRHGVVLPVDIDVRLDDLDAAQTNALLRNVFDAVVVRWSPTGKVNRLPIEQRVGVWFRGEANVPTLNAGVVDFVIDVAA